LRLEENSNFETSENTDIEERNQIAKLESILEYEKGEGTSLKDKLKNQQI